MKGKQRDHGYEAYMQEVHRYLGQVDRGRRVAGHDPMASQFSPVREDQRQATALGVPYQAPPQATAPYSKSLSPQYGFERQPYPPNYGLRVDGTQKGRGYLGELPTQDGRTMTEYSMGVPIGGRERLIPMVTPNQTREGINSLLAGGRGSPDMEQRAVEFAKLRLAMGLPFFAVPGEERSVETLETPDTRQSPQYGFTP